MASQVQVAQLHDWIRNAVSSSLSQAERERDKMLNEISRAVGGLLELCDQLRTKAEQDMETKKDNRAQYKAAKAVVHLTESLSEMTKQLTMPESRDTHTLRELQRTSSKLASDAAQFRAQWLRQIRPYYIIDMMTLGGNIDKLRRLSDELHQFLVGRGQLLRSLEDLDEKLSSLVKLHEAKDLATLQREAAERQLHEAEDTEASLRSDAEKIRQDPRIKEYTKIDSQLRELRTELLRTGFSRLGRPLRKLISITERGDYPVPPEIKETAREYVKRPFATFLAEEKNYPRLKAVMETLSKAVSSGKLALKQREQKKVIERTDQIVVENSLSGLQDMARELKGMYDSSLADKEIASLVENLRELRKKVQANRQVQLELRKELERSRQNEQKTTDQLSAMLREIEAFSRKISGTSVAIQL